MMDLNNLFTFFGDCVEWDISLKYGVHSLPTKFLIDKNGVIVGRYGEGGKPHEVMDSELKKIFGY